MGYSKNTIIGFGWMSGFRLVTRLIAFVKIAILARLLLPADFGVYGIAAIVLSFFETISQSGVSVLLMQDKKNSSKFLNSVFTLTIVRGILLFALIFASSPYIASFFHSTESIISLKLISFVALIRGFINPMRVQFLKTLNFGSEFILSFVVFLVDTTIAIFLTYTLLSPVGMIFGLIAGAFTELILSYLMIKVWPRIEFDIKIFKIIFSRGKWITLSTIFSNFFDQGPDIFVGRLLNTSSLGMYQAAYKISILPVTEFTRVINQVTFPIYVQLNSDLVRLKRAYVKTNIVLMILILFLGGFIFLFSNQITYLILGNNWLGVAPLLKSLAIFGMLRAITVSVNPLFNALKKQEYVYVISLISFVVFLMVVVPFLRIYGVFGASYAIITASLATLPFIYYYLRKVFSQ